MRKWQSLLTQLAASTLGPNSLSREVKYKFTKHKFNHSKALRLMLQMLSLPWGCHPSLVYQAPRCGSRLPLRKLSIPSCRTRGDVTETARPSNPLTWTRTHLWCSPGSLQSHTPFISHHFMPQIFTGFAQKPQGQLVSILFTIKSQLPKQCWPHSKCFLSL